jgi:hypothetical protein
MAGHGALVSVGAWINLDRLPGLGPAVFQVVSLDLATTVHIQAIVTSLLMYEYMTPIRINDLHHYLGARYGTQPHSHQRSTAVQAQDTGANLTEKTIHSGIHADPPIHPEQPRILSIYHQPHDFDSKLGFGGSQ